MKPLQTFLMILFCVQLSCSSDQNKDKTKVVYVKSREKIPDKLIEKVLEGLLEQLVEVKDSATEAKFMDSIWGFSRPEITDNPLRLMLSAEDSLGNNVIANLPSAKGKINITLTLSNRTNWRKTITFTPVSKVNIYLLMRE